MIPDRLPDPGPGIFAIAGICKNSGKTSFLNYLLAGLAGRKLGVLTTGRDGEAVDKVFSNPKPAVQLPAGTLFTGTPASLDKLGSAVTILQKLDWLAGGKTLWLACANRSAEAEITGPANAAAQIGTALIMQSQGAQTVLIDGSLDRKSIAVRPEVSGVFLVAGGSFGSLDKIQQELHRLSRLAGIRASTSKPDETGRICLFAEGRWQRTAFSTLLGNEQELACLIPKLKPERLYLPGALTDSLFHSVKQSWQDIPELVVRHPLHLQLSLAGLEQLLLQHKTACLYPFRLLALALNSWSVTGSHLDSARFRDSMRRSHPRLPVIDIRESRFGQS